MSLSTQQLLMKGVGIVLDPFLEPKTPDEFLSEYGMYLDTIVLVAKSENGTVYYPSSTAPVDPRFGIFFSSFTTLANDIGIKVYALLHSHLDYYLAKQPDFAAVQSNSSPVSGIICPSQQTYWFYLSEIAREVASFPIQGIILKNIHYPNQSFCFCDNCRRDFSRKHGIERDFTLDYLKQRPNLLSKWLNHRTHNITNLISTIQQSVHTNKKIDVYSELLVDQSVGFLDEVAKINGLDYSLLKTVSNNFLVHINPWSGIPALSSPEFTALHTRLLGLKTILQDGNQLGFFAWDLQSNEQLQALEKLSAELGVRQIFVQPPRPSTYMDLRSLHLELS